MIANSPERTPEFLFIFLSQGQFACVDFDAPPDVFRLKWYASWDKKAKAFYAIRKNGLKPNRKTVSLHRFIAGVSDSSVVVDHKNHVTLDNRRKNLRPCTKQQNAQNQRSRRGRSHYKGVCWSATEGIWRAQIKRNGKVWIIGRFKNEFAAALAYDQQARILQGEFSLCNFPLPDEVING